MADTGFETYVRDGKAVLRDTQTGKLTTHDPGRAGERVLSGRYTPVTAADVEQYEREKHGGTAVGAFAKSAAASAIDASQALITAPAALAARVHGDERLTPKRGGREVLEDLTYLFGGGSDAAREFTESSRAEAAAHPWATTAGSLVGSVAGGGGIAKAATGAAGALGLGRVATAGVTGALEGGAFGAVQAKEDAWFKDEDLTSEALVSSMGWNALIGGAVGLGLGGAGRLFGRRGSRGATPHDSTVLGSDATAATGAAGELAERAASQEPGALRSWLKSFSEERTTKALGARGSDIRKLGRDAAKAEAEMRRMARDVLEAELDDGTKVFKAVQSQDELVSNLARAQEEAGNKLSAFREKVNTFIEDKAPQLRPEASKIAKRIDDEVTAPLLQSAVPDVAAKAAPVQRISNAVRGLGDASLEKLTALRQDLDSIIYPKPTGPGLPPLPPAHVDQLVKVRGIIESEIEAATDRAAAKLGEGELSRYATLKGKWRSFREASQIAGKAQLQDLGNRVASPTDYLTGAAVTAGDMATGGGLSVLKGVAAAAAHKAVREHGSAMLAVLADRMAQNVDARIGRSVAGFFERSNALSRIPNGVGALERSRVGALPIVGTLEMFRGKHGDNVAAYRAKVAELQQANDNFGGLIRDRVQTALGDMPTEAPRLTGKVVNSATRAAQFLATKVPVPLRNSQSFTPSTDAPTPSDADIAKFARYYNTVSNPLSALRDLESGQLTSEQAETLQIVYPKLYERVRTHVIEQLSRADAAGRTLPYSAKIQLDQLLNLQGAGEPTASPEFMARYQQLAAQNAQQQAIAQQAKPVKINSDNIASPMDAMRKALS